MAVWHLVCRGGEARAHEHAATKLFVDGVLDAVGSERRHARDFVDAVVAVDNDVRHKPKGAQAVRGILRKGQPVLD